MAFIKKHLNRAVFLLVFIIVPSSFAYTTNMSASVVIGQTNFTNNQAYQGGSTSANGFGFPTAALVVGNKLVTTDGYPTGRVLVFNSIPTTNNASADVVIGQVDMTHTGENQGGAAAANTLTTSDGLATDGTKLMIADYYNHRLLIYNTVPTANNTAANVVVCQPDMTTVTSGTTASKCGGVYDADYDSSTGKLAVADAGNNRVLIFNSVPTTNGASANVVVGQTDFTSRSTGSTASTFDYPTHVKFINGKLLISEESNHRVLVFNTVPTSNGASADVVIGQPTLTSHSDNQGGSPAANTLSYPDGLGWDGSHLIIGDYGNYRFLGYNGVPTSNNASASFVIGQPDFTSNQANQGGSTAANTISYPGLDDITFYNNKMILCDGGNNRVLIFNDDVTPSPSPTGSPTPTPVPVSSTSSSVPIVENPNMKTNWAKEIDAGPDFVGEVRPITEVTAPDASALIQKDAIHDPLSLNLSIVHMEDLKAVSPRPMPLPWNNGIQVVSEIYNFNAVSAFNGFPILTSDKPYTVTIPYSPVLLKTINPSRLRIVYYDMTARRWKVLKNNTVLNREKGTLSNTTKLFTYFAVGY